MNFASKCWMFSLPYWVGSQSHCWICSLYKFVRSYWLLPAGQGQGRVPIRPGFIVNLIVTFAARWNPNLASLHHPARCEGVCKCFSLTFKASSFLTDLRWILHQGNSFSNGHCANDTRHVTRASDTWRTCQCHQITPPSGRYTKQRLKQLRTRPNHI